MLCGPGLFFERMLDTVVTKDTLSGLATLDAGEIDSCAADAIVQCALLGEMVYG